MDALENVLAAHAARYSQMQPTDAVKLIYQNEFGGGHLIRDEQICMARLAAEYRGVSQSDAEPLTEEIGNGILRVNLRALDAHGFSIEQLGTAFIHSAARQVGSLDSFLRKLELLRQMTKEGSLPFSHESLEAYLAEYKNAGYPMVSHSPEYRAAYAPAYRIIRAEFLPF